MINEKDILKVYESKDLERVCKKLYCEDWEELRSMVIESILKRPELNNSNLVAYSIQCAYNTFKNEIKKPNLVNLDFDVVEPISNIESKKIFEVNFDKLTEKISNDKNDIKYMYWANIYDVLIKNNMNILKAQKKIKLPYFEVRKAVREYESYLKYFFNIKEKQIKK